jgi:hypothetical protein
MSEKLRREIGVISTALLVGLGVSACGNSSAHKTTEPKPKTTASASPAVSNNIAELPQIQVRYSKNGMRELVFDNIQESGIIQGSKTVYNSLSPSNILQWCELGDLHEQSLGFDDKAGVSTAPIDIRENYKPCADNRLTPSDFPPMPAEQH